ncbi:hypothetical protein [Winogradskyella sp.]|uniref:hypothetical protein n=1 Tax=Winogradskyella sp. TaxID=1883156 RepID=UPI00262CC79B|nr:hypothetical protein [Winogradskyella sp.]
MQFVSFLFAVLVMFQSCRVYHYDSVSLDRAVAARKRVKIKTKNGQTFKYKQIIKDSNQFYGLKGKTKTLLLERNIYSIRLHNKVLSPILTVVALLCTGGMIAIVMIFVGVGRTVAELTPP